jgi:dTDP-4-amino-4,6-dideoxygalactose transaminase
LAIKGGERVRSEPFPSWPVWGEEEERAILSALRSGKWGLGGQYVSMMSRAFANYVGCAHCIPCMNGTVSLKVSLEVLDISEGDLVVTTPFTFIATTSAIIERGAIPFYVDVEEGGVNIDARLVEEAMENGASAILPVHVGGHPADMDALVRLSKQFEAPLVEDAAEAHGAEWRGRRIGGLGTLACFSFQSSKVLTSGEGGAITTNDAELAERCASIVNCGRRPGVDWYDGDVLGYNYRMTEFQAALLLAQLKRLDEQILLRQKNFETLASLCRELEGFNLITPRPEATRVPHYLVLVRASREFFGNVVKSRIVDALRAEGIPASVGWPVPLYRYHPVKRYLEKKGVEARLDQFPNAEAAASSVIFIHHRVLLGGEKEVEDVFRALQKIERHVGELS